MNYDIIYIPYENIYPDVSNGVDFELYKLMNLSKNLVKLYVVWLLKKSLIHWNWGSICVRKG
jgi:hypothetical protein